MEKMSDLVPRRGMGVPNHPAQKSEGLPLLPAGMLNRSVCQVKPGSALWHFSTRLLNKIRDSEPGGSHGS